MLFNLHRIFHDRVSEVEPKHTVVGLEVFAQLSDFVDFFSVVLLLMQLQQL